MFEGVHMTVDPVHLRLVDRSSRESVSAGAENGDKDRGRSYFTRFAVIDRDGVARPIDEHLFPGPVFLPENDILVPIPALVQLAEATVAIAAGLTCAVLLPNQLECQMLVALKLAVNLNEVWRSPRCQTPTSRLSGEEQFLQPAVVAVFRQRPTQTRRRGSLQISMNGRLTDRATAGDLVLPQTQTEPQAQHFSRLTHGHPFLGQKVSSTCQWRQLAPAVVQRRSIGDEIRFRKSFRHVNIHSGRTGFSIRFPPESLFTSLRNRYSHAPERLSTSPGIRNRQHFAAARTTATLL